MADLTEAYSALQKADAAGDTAGAKQLADYIRQSSAPTPDAPAAPPRSLLSEIGRQVALGGRAVAQGVAGLPLMAMDTGVGMRNLVTNVANGNWPKLADFNPWAAPGTGSPQPYELPSQTFNKSLTDMGVPEPQNAGEKIGGLLVSAAAGGKLPAPQAATQAPAAFNAGQSLLKNGILESAQKEGLVVPPSTANPTFLNRLMGGVAGKLKVQQAATINNQPIFNQLAAKALGQNPDAPLTSGALKVIRKEAADTGYAPVRSFGAMKTDDQFFKILDGLTQSAQGAEKSFPGIKPANSQLDTVVTALKQPTFDSADGVDAISHLRSLADDAYTGGQGSLGKAYKGAASALEDLIERNLKNGGPQRTDILQGFRDARTQIAKTYSVGKALNSETGDVNAVALANQLKAGKPLSGDLKTVASFARAFPKASKVPTESYEPISPIDTYGSAIAAGASHSALPLGLPLTRAALQRYLLSPAGQARAITQVPQPQTSTGLMGGFPALTGSGLLGP